MSETKHKRKDENGSAYIPSVGKMVIVASGDESITATQQLRDNCVCFDERTRFRHLVCTMDKRDLAIAKTLVPDGNWEVRGDLHSHHEGPDVLHQTAEKIDTTEVALIVVNPDMRWAMQNHYKPNFKPFFPRGKGARILLFSFDEANNFLGLSELSN